MKKRILYGIIMSIFLLLIINKIGEENHIKYPKDFNFTYRFGVNGIDFIDTYNDILKYDSVDGLIELKLVLSVEEKNEIYLKMTELNFMKIPSNFPVLLKVDIDPMSKSHLIAEYKNEKNEVRWSTLNFNAVNYENPTEGNEALKAINEIGEYIEQIVIERIKTMNLPERPLYL